MTQKHFTVIPFPDKSNVIYNIEGECDR